MMKLGLATSVLYQYAIIDAISMIAKCGYEGVDIWGGRPHVYRQDLSSAELQQLRKLIDDHGLLVSSFMPAFYRYPHSLSSPNPKVRQVSISYMLECIDNAASLGANLVLVVPDHSLYGQSREDSQQRMIESIDTIAHCACNYQNVRLGIEILYYDETDFINSTDDALNIIHQLGHDNIGVVLDTGTLNLSKEPVEDIIGKLGNLLYQVHVNDNQGQDRQQNLIPGEGNYDFKSLIQHLKNHNYCGFLSAELSKEYANEPEFALKTTAERLNKWIQEN
jgi:protein FrlC